MISSYYYILYHIQLYIVIYSNILYYFFLISIIHCLYPFLAPTPAP